MAYQEHTIRSNIGLLKDLLLVDSWNCKTWFIRLKVTLAYSQFHYSQFIIRTLPFLVRSVGTIWISEV